MSRQSSSPLRGPQRCAPNLRRLRQPQLSLHAVHGATTHTDQRCHLEDALPGSQMVLDGVLDLGRDLGAAELLSMLKIDSVAPVAVGLIVANDHAGAVADATLNPVQSA